MSCLTPLKQYHRDDGSYTFNPTYGYNPFSIPCGQCLGCRIDHSRDWALRCMHHAKLYEKNCFITLTFDEQHLQNRKSVNVEDFQLFMKRFRRYLYRKNRNNLQYFHSMEYGEKKSRPHHHAVLFNYFPPDAQVYKNVGGNIYYKSEELTKLWNNQGFIVIGELTYTTAAYTASYTFKKQKSKTYAPDVSPEKMTCSQSIGVSHFLKYYKDYCQLGHIIFNGKRHRIPRAYLKKLAISPLEREKVLNNELCLLPETKEKYDWLMHLKLNREANARPDNILDRAQKYRFLINNQKNYVKKYAGDTPLTDDNRYLKQLKSLEAEILQISGEYHPQREKEIYESICRL